MEYKHFSHQHNLKLHKLQAGQQLHCSGCETLCFDDSNSSSSSVYACWECNFFLHEHCGNANRYIKHPHHTLHPLILAPSPTYAAGSFLCNACAAPGSSFSYSCPLCEVDLHIPCAFLPPKVNHQSHPHELGLSYSTNTSSSTSTQTICTLCNQLILETRQWTYYCLKCDFRAHTFCTTREVKPGLYREDGDYERSDENGSVGTTTTPTAEGQSAGAKKQNGDCEEAALAQHQAGTTSTTAEVAAENDPVVELYRLKLQMEMSQQLAQMMGSFNLASFV